MERTDTRDAILSQLVLGPHTREELADKVGLSAKSQTYRRAIDEMVMVGQILQEGTGVRGKPYSYRLFG